jgi:hypothetical protein
MIRSLLLLTVGLGLVLGQCRHPNIVDLAVGTPSLSTLVTLLTKANLVPALEGAGPFTVFAPVNQGFANANIPAVNGATLVDLLTYHVAPGAFPESALNATNVIPSLEGAELHVDFQFGRVTVNGFAGAFHAVGACNGDTQHTQQHNTQHTTQRNTQHRRHNIRHTTHNTREELRETINSHR